MSFAANSHDPGALAVAAIAAVIIALHACRRGSPVRRAATITFGQAAFLVPAAMATVAVACLERFARGDHTLHENPFGVAHARQLGLAHPTSWIALAAVGLAIAGQIGLLAARARGKPPTSAHFVRGIVDYGPTVVLAKIALAGACYWISTTDPVGLQMLAYAAPCLLLAPVLGAAARYPGRPVNALAAGIATGVAHPFRTAGLVGVQVLFVAGVFAAYDRFLCAPDLHWNLLTFSSSALSYNAFPIALLDADPVGHFAVLAALAVGSSVFVTAHFVAAGGERATPSPARRRRPRLLAFRIALPKSWSQRYAAATGWRARSHTDWRVWQRWLRLRFGRDWERWCDPAKWHDWTGWHDWPRTRPTDPPRRGGHG